jgi:hypothetical protein
MNDIKVFLKSKLAKRILIGLAIVIVLYIASKQYEKYIYNGFTKSQIISEVAKDYALERILAHKNEGFDTQLSMATWYDENHPPSVTDYRINKTLDRLGIDYAKYPKILNIKNEVNKIAWLKNYI